MGIIGFSQNLVDPDLLDHPCTKMVVDETHRNVLAEVFARWMWKHSMVDCPTEMVCPVSITVLEKKRDPSDIALGEHDLQSRKSFEHPAHDPVDERELRVEWCSSRLDDARRVRCWCHDARGGTKVHA